MAAALTALRCADYYADLTADLTAVYLTGSDLTGAYLTGWCNCCTVLTAADLTGTDLPATNLTGAVLTAPPSKPLHLLALTLLDLTAAAPT